MFRNLKDRALSAEATSVYYTAVMLLPNLLLCITEPYSWSTMLASLLMPAGFYLLLSVARPRSGWVMLATLPLMVLDAFQIVILKLFGGSIIAVDMFTNLFTTNASEAGELLGNLWTAVLFVCVVYIPAIVLAIRSAVGKRRLSVPFRRRAAWGALAAAVVGVLCTAISWGTRPEFRVREHIFPINVLYNIHLSIDRWHQSLAYPETSRSFCFDTRRDSLPAEREIYVYVIGEASRAASWSLMGYERPTNPLLSERVGHGLIPFSDVLTESNATHKSVPIMLSATSAIDHEQIYREKSIITAFKEAGFRTLYFSNQVPNRSLIDYFSEEADHRIDISPREGTLYTDNRPDGELLPHLRRAIDTTQQNLFIVIHTYGSHFDYRKRYPDNFSYFTPDRFTAVDSKNRTALRNAYDNSVRYTDYVMDGVIGALEHAHCCTAMIYTADHGEDLMDDRRERFLHSSPLPTYYQLHVAAFGWFSDDYRSLYADRYDAALRHARMPYSTGSMFHTVADVAGLKSRYLNPTRSLVSRQFVARDRFYLNDHNQAVEFYNTGLRAEDFQQLDQRGIHYRKGSVRNIKY